MILNVQFYEGDKAQAMALVRLICDLEPTFRHDVAILFTARFDAEHDYETIAYASRKFATYELTCKRKVTGWPNGPNQMMGESYCYCVEKVRSGAIENQGPVMFVEADSVPLHADWLNLLISEYKASGKMVSGAWLKRDDAGIEHVNGNLIMSLDFWRRCREIFNPVSRGGWDATLAHAILPNAHPSKLIWSDYQLDTPKNPWKGCEYLWSAKRYRAKDNPLYGQDLFPVWLHGIKSMKGIDCARARLLEEVLSKKG